MKQLTTLGCLVLTAMWLFPATTVAQSAWVMPKGEVNISFNFQWLDAHNHLLSDAVEGSELTPIELKDGVDFDSKVRDIGTVQSQVYVVDGDIGLTDRFSLNGGVAIVAPRYLGSSPHVGFLDDGLFHGSFQDARIGARYMALDKGTFVLTPFATFLFPVADYETLGHAAQGRGLKELQVGASVGQILMFGGAPKAFVDAWYSYSFMENVSDTIALDRSTAVIQVGYFLGSRLTLIGLTSLQRIHGGIEWADLGVDAGPSGLGAAHDQAAASRDWRFGGGLSFQVNEMTSLYVSLNSLLWGENTHDASTVTFGVNWGFQAFGGLMLSPEPD